MISSAATQSPRAGGCPAALTASCAWRSCVVDRIALQPMVIACPADTFHCARGSAGGQTPGLPKDACTKPERTAGKSVRERPARRMMPPSRIAAQDSDADSKRSRFQCHASRVVEKRTDWCSAQERFTAARRSLAPAMQQFPTVVRGGLRPFSKVHKPASLDQHKVDAFVTDFMRRRQ